MRVILYPELVDYVLLHYSHLETEEEQMTLKAIRFFKTDTNPNNKKQFLSMTEAEKEIFKENVASRIWKQHQHELNLNLCPKCGKIARTPEAKQCRFCYHDWH